METKEKFNYLRGLFDGLNVDKKSKEGVTLHSIISFLGEVSTKIEELERENMELKMVINSLEDEIQEIAQVVFEDEKDEVEEITCINCGKTIFITSSQDKIVCPKCEAINIHN